MKIISFNINGIRARLHQLQQIIDKYQPEIIGLQEIKVHDDDFPPDLAEKTGYHIAHYGQKGHYGVAIFSKQKPIAVYKGLGEDPDQQRRMIAIRYPLKDQHLTLFNGYFPQGENRSHPTKFPMKERFYRELLSSLQRSYQENENILVMGDMNVSCQDIDIGIGEKNRLRWLKEGKCSFLPEEREWLNKLLDWGLIDSFRHHNPTQNDVFSWFDYRSKGFEDNPKRGLRIDLILLTANLLKLSKGCWVDYEIRGIEKPSDHAPVVCELDI